VFNPDDKTSCDVPEKCTGTSPTCPPDQVLAQEDICRPATSGLCSEPARCDGKSGLCPPNPFKTAGTVCRLAVYSTDGTTCDLPEKCNGFSDACPDDTQHVAAGIVCRPSAGVCDVEEVCSEVVETGKDA
jgi:hypothetical protein